MKDFFGIINLSLFYKNNIRLSKKERKNGTVQTNLQHSVQQCNEIF